MTRVPHERFNRGFPPEKCSGFLNEGLRPVCIVKETQSSRGYLLAATRGPPVLFAFYR